MKKETRNAASAAPTPIIENEQQMLEQAYQDIPENMLTCYDIDRIEEEWLTRQKKHEAIDEVHRLTRPRNRNTPHEI